MRVVINGEEYISASADLQLFPGRVLRIKQDQGSYPTLMQFDKDEEYILIDVYRGEDLLYSVEGVVQRLELRHVSSRDGNPETDMIEFLEIAADFVEWPEKGG